MVFFEMANNSTKDSKQVLKKIILDLRTNAYICLGVWRWFSLMFSISGETDPADFYYWSFQALFPEKTAGYHQQLGETKRL